MSSTKKITLKSSDGEAFEVDEAVALQSQAIKYMIENNCPDSDIPLPNVTSKILAKVIEYYEKHVKATNPKDIALMAWDAAFIQVDLATLMGLVLAAKYLEIQSLRNLACKTLAQAMKWVTPGDLLEIAQGEDSR